MGHQGALCGGCQCVPVCERGEPHGDEFGDQRCDEPGDCSGAEEGDGDQAIRGRREPLESGEGDTAKRW